ncbi:MAG: histidine--tRNA ligase [Tissierellia bacterium]|nr:histidine--tRNA ligase [Tissierellia bacterium]
MNIIKPSVLPGFMDLLPKDQLVFNKMKEIIEDNFKKFAYLPLDTPAIEKTEILLAKGGGETSKQVYNIESSSRNMSMRFDLTVPLARFVAEHYHELEFPFRRYHIGKVYRGERNQRGRFKEFYQCDIDIIGDEFLDIRNDAEIPLVIYNIFKELNFTEMTFHLNNRKLLNGFLDYHGIDNFTEVLRIIDKIAKVSEQDIKEMLSDIIPEVDKVELILQFISYKGENTDVLNYLEELKIDNDKYSEGLKELSEVYKYMRLFEIPDENICLDMSITRGLDYYTGTVYETFLDNYKSIGSVCSGGRYDDLASNYTKKSLPGIGISIGLTRLFYQLNEADLIDIPTRSVADVVIYPMADCYEYGVKVVDKLRDEGIIAQIYFEPGKFKKKLNYANKLNIPYIIILGDDELSKDEVALKDMDTGEQISVCIDEAIKIIHSNKL